MSFGSGFGAPTSTPAPTFAFGTTPASTATPVKPGKSFFARLRVFHSSFPFSASSLASTSSLNVGAFTIPRVPCLHKYLAAVYMCDNFGVKNGTEYSRARYFVDLFPKLRSRHGGETGSSQFLVELVLLVMSEALFSKG